MGHRLCVIAIGMGGWYLVEAFERSSIISFHEWKGDSDDQTYHQHVAYGRSYLLYGIKPMQMYGVCGVFSHLFLDLSAADFDIKDGSKILGDDAGVYGV